MRWPELRVAVATEPIAVEDLSAGERDALPASGSARAHDWLLGRAALKRLLGGVDTSAIGFPHRCVSLTHAAGLAVAVEARGHQAGVGVDYEADRPIDPRTARFYLHDGEDGDRLRLWTVKEALFKATPENGGAVFLDYRLTADPAALTGTAVDRHGRRFAYATRRFRAGWLTTAVSDAAL